MTELAAQLGLFAGSVAAYAPPARQPAPAPLVIARPVQFVIELRERIVIDPDEIADEGDYFTHTRVSATDLPPPKTRAACSIFALASEAAARQVISEFMLGRDPEPQHAAPADSIHRSITREGDVVRHCRLRHDETPEWAEKEQARRARQKLPKPPKQKFRIRKETA